MKKKLKYLLILPVLGLTSCGYSLGYLVKGNRYISSDFQENYYRDWNAELKNANKASSIDVTEKKITSFNDIAKVDPNFLVDPSITDVEDYGKSFKMSDVDESFKYGYQSKLFDGRVICGGLYQRSRVQSDANGFSVRFAKESNDLNYFALNFKTTTDNTVNCYPVGEDQTLDEQGLEGNARDKKQFHNSTFTLKIGIYTKENEKIVNHEFTSYMAYLDNQTNNGSFYTFFAFDLKEYNLSRCVGFSISYDNLSDELIDWNKNKGVDITHALFVYEAFLPYTVWH